MVHNVFDSSFQVSMSVLTFLIGCTVGVGCRHLIKQYMALACVLIYSFFIISVNDSLLSKGFPHISFQVHFSSAIFVIKIWIKITSPISEDLGRDS